MTAAAAVALLVGGLLPAAFVAPASGVAPDDPGHRDTSREHHAKPTIASVNQRLDALHRRAEVASEAYNATRVKVQAAREQMTSLRADLSRQRTQVADLRRDIVSAALTDYVSTGGLSVSASFLASRSPSQFVNSLASNAVTQYREAELLANLRQQQRLLSAREAQAERQLSVIRGDQQRLAEHKAALDRDVRATDRLLGRLKEQQRRRILAMQRHQTSNPSYYGASRGAERPPGAPAGSQVSGRAAVAVATALAQVGKPYVYGAAGPSSFDCSGLTMYSWAAAGVSLSHASSVQSQQGVPVSLAALQPGDLVFYYSPVSHVAMYIGNGMVVHAPYPGSVVQVVPLYSMPVSWARRVG